MRKLSFWCLCAALLTGMSACDKGEETPGGGDGQTRPDSDIVFFDDFDSGTVPDPEWWKLCEYVHVAWAQYFKNTDGYSNVRIENGCLVLTADKTADGLYRNGGVRTRKGFQPGTIVEVRARFDKARGGFPAIWQMPVGGKSWPQSGEIDIMEWIQGNPNLIYYTIHTAYKADDPSYTGDVSEGRTWSSNTLDSEFHTYAAARSMDAVKFYIDGVLMWQYKDAGLYGTAAQRQFPFIFWNFDLILNYSLGGYLNGNLTWPGEIHDEDLPASMYVDWVRVRKL
ncbi:MAG: glycoside hydrolase family 16 protein [Coprobacter sp.]|nr:glycoside hydrolase family 16 protein [Coprobacter sp.]